MTELAFKCHPEMEPILSRIDNRFGPITRVLGIKSSKPDWWIFYAPLSRPIGTHFVDFACDGWGASIDRQDALRRCLGEASERYCWFNGQATYRRMRAGDIHYFNSFPRCAENEECVQGFKGIDPDWQLSMTGASEVSDGREHWIPAAYVYLLDYHELDEPAVCNAMSTGTAFHRTLLDAVWSGLCEVAERDAFMLAWLNQISPKEILIDPRSAPYQLSSRLKRFAEGDLSIRFFDITSEFRVPTLLSITRSSLFPYLNVTVTTHAEPLVALTKCLDETIVVTYAQRMGGSESKPPSLKDFSWIRDLAARADLYSNWPDTPAFDFVCQGKGGTIALDRFLEETWWTRPQSWSDLKAICQRLKEDHGLSVLYSDITTDDMRDCGITVRVVVPQMMPLIMSERAKWLATPRLINHARKHGVEPSRNPYPHPFP